MSDWLPDYLPSGSLKYVAIADALARDIQSGALKPGDRLPTHRELAYKLGVSISTASKAFAEATRRQHIHASVGRGSFVAPSAWSDRSRLDLDEDHAGGIDLSFNCPIVAAPHMKALADTLQAVAADRQSLALQGYHRPWTGIDAHRQAGAQWLERHGMRTHFETISITAGAQHAAAIVLGSLLSPGDSVVTEELTDPGVKLLCAHHRIRLKGLAIDEFGICPAALDAACREAKIRALFCIPNHHSPTLSVLPEERRKEIADIARRYDLLILENDVYGAFVENPPLAVASFAPERSFYFSSLSKIISPGLRLGFLAAPPGRAAELMTGFGSTCWMASHIMAEVGARWIREGTAERLASWQRQEMAYRNEMVRKILGRLDVTALASSLHVWLRLPEPWRADGFAKQLRGEGVWVTPAEAFAVGQGAAPQAVRISLGGATPSRSQLQQGLEILARALESRPAANFVIM